MKKNINIEEKYKIESNIIKNYIDTINSTTKTINQIKVIQKEQNDSKFYSNINSILKEIKKLIEIYPNEKTKIYTNIIKQIMKINNGIISTRLIEPLEISRQYISILKNNNEIERVTRGIYQTPNIFEDSFYSFQSKYKKAIYSHMNALYFYGLTEEYPYNYTVTVPQNYHVNTVNDKCNVFYVSDDILELGICEVKTPSGNKVRTYDVERSICDIIRTKNRMDLEQIKKTIKQYIKRKDKNLSKLSEYSKKMGINKQVMELVGMFNE